MITVPELVEELVQRTPYIEDALSEGLLNTSALARKLQPEVEQTLLKPVTTGSIGMALKRYAARKRDPSAVLADVFREVPDMIVRSNLGELTVRNGSGYRADIQALLQKVGSGKQGVLIVTQGVFETTIIVSREYRDMVQKIFEPDQVVSRFDSLSAITILLPERVIAAPGVYYRLLRPLALESIHLIEVASTFSELTLVLEDTLVDRAFSSLKRTFAQAGITSPQRS